MRTSKIGFCNTVISLRAACYLLVLLTMQIEAQDLEQEQEKGRYLFENLCVSCHGLTGDGDGVAVKELFPEPRSFGKNEFKFDTDADWVLGSAVDISNVIRNGTAAYGGSQNMPAWSNLSEEQVTDLTAYVLSLVNGGDS